MQLVSANGSPLFSTMTHFLKFIYETQIQKNNQREIASLNGKELESASEEETILEHGPEFICQVMFHHIFFSENVQWAISLQFQNNNSLVFRNFYQNNAMFKIDDFDFHLLFDSIGDIDKILRLVRALLLEKKVILIKEDTGDIAIIMQTLMSLLAPFTWPFPLITNL
jgi:hypothetical protein